MNNAKDSNWMVLYTRSRWEKKVHQLLKEQRIISYCPLVKVNKQWADRKKTIELPLFNSYVFVRANRNELDKILQTTGVVSYVKFCGQPAIVRDQEIEDIRAIVLKYSHVKTVALAESERGDKATISNGPLATNRAEAQQVKGQSVVMVIQSMNCALTVETGSKELIDCQQN